MEIHTASLRRAFVSFAVLSLCVLPSVASAGGLCVQDPGGRQYVLSKVSPKISAAKAKPFGGVSVFGGYVRPVSGVATRSSAGNALSLAFTEYPANVNSGPAYLVVGGSKFHQIEFTGADAIWDVGDTGVDCYWEGGSGAGVPACQTLTAIDCSTVVLP